MLKKPHGNFKDKTGLRFGNQIVLSPHGRNVRGDIFWLVKCDCGDTRPVIGSSLTRKARPVLACTSCHPLTNLIHNMSQRKDKYNHMYGLWLGIKKRCYNPNSKAYKNYGGRGIGVYPPWQTSFPDFYFYIIEYLGEKPTKKHSLDRSNNDGNYEPGNLRWATRKIQNGNTRRSYKVMRMGQNGEIKSYEKLSDVAKDGFSVSCVCACIKGKRKSSKGSIWKKYRERGK